MPIVRAPAGCEGGHGGNKAVTVFVADPYGCHPPTSSRPGSHPKEAFETVTTRSVPWLRVTIRVRPGSSRTRVGGPHGDALVVRVGARAADGKATEAALRALAEALGVARSDVRLLSGVTSRTKVVEVATEEDGESQRVRERLAELRSVGGVRGVQAGEQR